MRFVDWLKVSCGVVLLLAASTVDAAESGNCGEYAIIASTSGCEPIGSGFWICSSMCDGDTQICTRGKQIVGGLMNFGYQCGSGGENCCIHVSWPLEQCDCKCVDCPIPYALDKPLMCGGACTLIGTVAIKVDGFCEREKGEGQGADDCGWNPV